MATMLWEFKSQAYTIPADVMLTAQMGKTMNFASNVMSGNLRDAGIEVPEELFFDANLDALTYDMAFSPLFGYHVLENLALPIIFIPPANAVETAIVTEYKYNYCCVLNPMQMPRMRGSGESTETFYLYGKDDWFPTADRIEHARDWSLRVQNALFVALSQVGFFVDYIPQLCWCGPHRTTLQLHMCRAGKDAMPMPMPMEGAVTITSTAHIDLNLLSNIRRAAFFMLPARSKSVIGMDLSVMSDNYVDFACWDFI